MSEVLEKTYEEYEQIPPEN